MNLLDIVKRVIITYKNFISAHLDKEIELSQKKMLKWLFKDQYSIAYCIQSLIQGSNTPMMQIRCDPEVYFLQISHRKGGVDNNGTFREGCSILPI